MPAGNHDVKKNFNLVPQNVYPSPMHIILAVTNDISTDQRVIRTAHTLHNMKARVTIIGRRFGKPLEYIDLRFKTIRMKLVFNRGPLFYAEYNLRLFWKLMIMKADILISNDLDTLPAVYLASKIRNTSLVYDSHEYFTEVPELMGRRGVQRVWERLESLMMPHIIHACTVSSPIAMAYQNKYGIKMQVIRNLPFKRDQTIRPSPALRNGSERIILYQGSLNIGRGLELAIQAIQFTSNVRLIIIGKGDMETKLKQLALTLGLQDRITFTGRISPDQLIGYTIQADLGISLEEDLGLNYRFALPNKVFDYIQAEVPVLVSDLPELRSLVEEYKVGMINNSLKAEELGALFTAILSNEAQLQVWKTNLKIAAAELCWEKEEPKLIALVESAFAKA
jgi:glycosyltransferase involved in cell wall biosynthesis